MIYKVIIPSYIIMTSKKPDEKYMPLFRLKPIDGEHAKCRFIGNVKGDEKVFDEPFDVNDVGDKDVLAGGAFGKYEICVKACTCNITGSYLLKNTKLPIHYVTVLYERQYVSGYLFTLFLNFTIDDETQKELTTPQKYVNKRMKGKYTLNLVADDSFFGKFLEHYKKQIEIDVMEKYVDDFQNATSDETELIMQKISLEVQSELDIFKKMFEPVEITDVRKKNIIAQMKNIINNSYFSTLISAGLAIREKSRVEEVAPDLDYRIPKRTINLKELHDNPETVDARIEELLANISDDSEDSE